MVIIWLYLRGQMYLSKQIIELLNKYAQATHQWSGNVPQSYFGKDYKPQPTTEPSGPHGDAQQPLNKPAPKPMPKQMPVFNANQIKIVQQFLASQYGPQILGPKGVDGNFGQFTSAALKKWQQDNDFNASGQLDQMTLNALVPAIQANNLKNQAGY